MTSLVLAVLAQVSLPAPEGTVTMPLSAAAPLFHAAPVAAPPLVSAAVVSAKLEGRATPEALEVTAHVTAEVLDAAKTARLGLFALSPGTMLVGASTLEGATVAAHQGEVCLLATRPGRFSFDVQLLVKARAEGQRREARLSLGRDGLEAVLRVDADGERVALAGGSEVYPSERRWVLAWENVVAPRVELVAKKPPLEPRISAARAQLVSTVEGRALVTAWYELELDREQTLGVDVPEGFTLQRLLVNGVPQRVPGERHLELPVSPARAGEHEGRVELGLVRELGVFHLSGKVSVALPKVSWPIALVQASVHLPTVFQYRRTGGSLEPGELSEWTPPPMPGRALAFQQHLVSASAPTLELEYFVDLDGRYFSARGGAAPARR